MKRLLVLAAVLLFSPASFAGEVQMEYITHGGFITTVSGFTRIANLMNDSSFTGLTAVAFGMGVLFYGLSVSYTAFAESISGNANQGQNRTAAGIITAALGVAIFSAGVYTKGELYIYDDQSNDFQTVEAPLITVLSAGAFNAITEAVHDPIIDSSDSAISDTTPEQAMELLLNAVNKAPDFMTGNLSRSISQFYTDCAPAQVSMGKFNPDTIIDNTTDIFDTLANLKSNSIYTTYYSDDAPGGIAETCTTAYADISSELTQATATSPSYLKSVCDQAGYDSSSSTQFASCQEDLLEVAKATYGLDSGSAQIVARNYLLNSALYDTYKHGSSYDQASAQINNSMFAQSMSSMVSTGLKMPAYKTALTTIIIGITPIILLFFPTPILGRALKLYLSLFAYLVIWYMADDIMVAAQMDSIWNAMSNIQHNSFGLKAIWLTPSKAIEALSIIGDSRTLSFAIVTFIVSPLFGVNAYAMHSMTAKAERMGDELGRSADKNVFDSSTNGQHIDALTSSNVGLSGLGHYSYLDQTRSQAFEKNAQIEHGMSESRALHNDASAKGKALAAQSVGNIKGVQATGYNKTADITQGTTERNLTRQEGYNANTSMSDAFRGGANAGSNLHGENLHTTTNDFLKKGEKEGAHIAGEAEGMRNKSNAAQMVKAGANQHLTKQMDDSEQYIKQSAAHGRTVEQSLNLESMHDTANRMGQVEPLAKDPEKGTQQTYDRAAYESEQGNARVATISKNLGQTPAQAGKTIGNFNGVTTFANADHLRMVQGILGTSSRGAAVFEQNHAATPQQMKKLVDAGVISRKAYEVGKDGATLSFDGLRRDENGNVTAGNVRVQKGTTAEDNDSVTVNKNTTVGSSSDPVQINQTMADESQIRVLDKTGQVPITMANGWSANGQVQAAAQDAKNSQVGAHGQVGISFMGNGASVSVDANKSHQDTQSKQMNTNMLVAQHAVDLIHSRYAPGSKEAAHLEKDFYFGLGKTMQSEGTNFDPAAFQKNWNESHGFGKDNVYDPDHPDVRVDPKERHGHEIIDPHNKTQLENYAKYFYQDHPEVVKSLNSRSLVGSSSTLYGYGSTTPQNNHYNGGFMPGSSAASYNPADVRSMIHRDVKHQLAKSNPSVDNSQNGSKLKSSTNIHQTMPMSPEGSSTKSDMPKNES